MNCFFNNICEILRKNRIESPRLEARILAGFVLNKEYSIISGFEELSADEQEKISLLAQKRIAGCPIDKIIGKKSFYKSDFFVDENVLSPRPDTEILVESAIEIAQKNDFSSVVDLGTGSGCILLSVLQDCPNLHGLGIDASQDALKTAEKNMKSLNLTDRATLLHLSWNNVDFAQKIGKKFDMIVSNPPYIPESDAASLAKEVINFDPKEALFAGSDGLKDYRAIAKVAPNILNDGGYILLEAGIHQAEEIEKIFETAGFVWQKTVNDLASIPRCVILKK